MATGKKLFNRKRPYGESGAVLITLIVIMVIFGLMIAVFSTHMTSKRLTEPLSIQSTQALYIAQAGIEWAIRYATDRFGEFTTDPNTVLPGIVVKDFTRGRFSIDYDSQNGVLTSTGQVGTAQRKISLSSFLNYIAIGTELDLIPTNPPCQGATGADQKNLHVPFSNYYDQDIYIFQIDVAKINSPAQLNEINFDTTLVWEDKKYNLSVDPDNPSALSISTFTMVPGPLTVSFNCQTAPEVLGTWYITIHYSMQSDLSDPLTKLFTITII
ncbi:MAG: hypothetical protein ACMUJM_03975 [bacterium]